MGVPVSRPWSPGEFVPGVEPARPRAAKLDRDRPPTSKMRNTLCVCAGGGTNFAAPLSQNSSKDNLRPVVPKWDASHTLLLWERGDYNTAQTYVTEIVGTTALSSAAP